MKLSVIVEFSATVFPKDRLFFPVVWAVILDVKGSKWSVLEKWEDKDIQERHVTSQY